MPRQKKYPDELRERAVRLVFGSGRPVAHVANDLGINYESLRKWVRQAEADAGKRADLLTSSERERLTELERENRELRKANEILKAASVFSQRRLDPPRPTTSARSASCAMRPFATGAAYLNFAPEDDKVRAAYGERSGRPASPSALVCDAGFVSYLSRTVSPRTKTAEDSAS